ncbi:MAG TPA: carboxypeptidase regulatory-like domain-containing protein [Woeseiaceae bacterium]|nr:carboxypeptidase regulatory-like domain-containing protein [Woeseiaceae bacterium]
MDKITLQRYVRAAAVALCLALSTQAAMAQSQDGALAGHTAPGAEVTVRDPSTGFSRTITSGADGSYRFPFLPVGTYTLEASRDGELVVQPVQVVISLGKTTVANAGANVDVIQVVGSRVAPAFDVTSTESGTNLTKLELERLPVDRDLLSVAALASGVNRGEFGGASFGGSSVAENAVYINGLNVTDFYRRIGFSSVPYAFYEEFQVKTGGYSVEFGRTTGGVINAVTRSGTNEFEFGAEAVWEPSFLQGDGENHYNAAGDPVYIASYDEYDRQSLNLYAGGPIVQDKLFFFAMYELRSYEPVNTNNSGSLINEDKSDDAFWGAKIDWQINDNNLVEFLAFSDEDTSATDVYQFDYTTGSRGAYQNTEYLDSGGLNWSTTYTSYLTDSLSVRAMYGENERNSAQFTPNDIDCNRIRDFRPGGAGDIGCTSSSSVVSRVDSREQARLDFQWSLGDHQVRFGVDREVNTSNHLQHYPGPGRLVYEINEVDPGSTLPNGTPAPAGVTAYVRTRTNEVDGEFESTNFAFYLEDSWQLTDTLVVDAGLRLDEFDNKDSDGRSYIKMDDMLAPRLGFAWDMKGDARSKVFGNVGRYYLPVANVINIKQAGGFADVRTFYAFEGLEEFEYNGTIYQRPILGDQIGPVDDSQGDGSVGDLRGEVDADMDPVYQDEIILGYQAMIDDKWSWGVRGIYRELTNAIDDMEITSNGIVCGGEPTYVGWVMANPGEPVTVFTDTDCDGTADAFVTIDTSQGGWARHIDGEYVGDTGFPSPERTYKALEFMVDRAWDDRWSVNASYTLSYSEGNTEGPVNSDTNFSDTGRTENFDTPWVNFRAEGYLPNDHRHQVKLRGVYGFNDNWQLGGSLIARSGSPINAFGDGVPFDDDTYRTYFVCVSNCNGLPSERQFEHRPRGSAGRLPWTYDLGLSLTYRKTFNELDLSAKFAVYNVLDQQRTLGVEEDLEPTVGTWNEEWLMGTSYQSPRYAQFLVTVDF